ncbi:MAG: hypothetical protein EOM50_12645 [Erysipelotrichia bacterium]|nr:hypothetical protein [Erysipelotrichia bacterium]NCC54432.1 hypothetical protein [Erysipelotrichia bacterium]
MKRNKMFVFQCLLFVGIVAFIYFAVMTSDESTKKESTRQIEQALEKALMTCYSVEGAYPKTLAQLVENYPVYIDEDKYMIHYIYEGANMKPDILVMRKDVTHE